MKTVLAALTLSCLCLPLSFAQDVSPVMQKTPPPTQEMRNGEPLYRVEVIGRDIPSVLQKYRTLLPNKFYIAREGLQADGVFVEADPASGRALRIERIQEKITLA